MLTTGNKPGRHLDWRDRRPHLCVLTCLLALASIASLLVCLVGPGSTVLAHEAVYPLQQTVQPTLPPRPTLAPTLPPRPTPGSTLAPRPTLVPTVITRPTLAPPNPPEAPRPAPPPPEAQPTPIPTPAVLPVTGGTRSDSASLLTRLDCALYPTPQSCALGVGLISGCGALMGASLVLRRRARYARRAAKSRHVCQRYLGQQSSNHFGDSGDAALPVNADVP